MRIHHIDGPGDLDAAVGACLRRLRGDSKRPFGLHGLTPEDNIKHLRCHTATALCGTPQQIPQTVEVSS